MKKEEEEAEHNKKKLEEEDWRELLNLLLLRTHPHKFVYSGHISLQKRKKAKD